MALEQLLAALETGVAAQIVELEAQAAAETQRLRAQVEADVEAIRSRRLEAARPAIQAERSRRLNVARLDAQRIQLEVREALLEAVFEAGRACLAQARRRPDYGCLLAALVDEVLHELGAPVRLQIDSRDAELVHGFLAGCRDGVTVELDLQTWGGVVGHTSDGQITVDNTLETRYAQVREGCRGQVASLLGLNVSLTNGGAREADVSPVRLDVLADEAVDVR